MTLHELMTPLDIKHKEVRNQPSLDYREVPAFMTDLLERRDNAFINACLFHIDMRSFKSCTHDEMG